MQKTAVISVANKTGIVDFAKRLCDKGFRIISTGGTARVLEENGVDIIPVSDATGHPEILNGRVKTLHPVIHGGILADRDNQQHVQELKELGIGVIDLVCVNLYPFEKVISKPIDIKDAIENIDIGGVALLRAAAKNYKYVYAVCDQDDYSRVLISLGKESSQSKLREELAVKAFAHTSNYDSIIEEFLSQKLLGDRRLHLVFHNGEKLRYGENSHQNAVFYHGKDFCYEILHGKAMSYNNYLDCSEALHVVKEVASLEFMKENADEKNAAVSIVKHTNPCGLATGATTLEALEAAWSCDTVSAFGSIIASCKEIDLEAAQFLKGKFVEIIIAPSYTNEAFEFLKSKSKDLRIVKIKNFQNNNDNNNHNNNQEFLKQYKSVLGGMLEQTNDAMLYQKWECVTEKKFDEHKHKLAEFTLTACKHTKSNAVVLGIEYKPGCFKVLGMGAGQPNRVDSLRKLALSKAYENLDAMGLKKEKLSETVLASDAFFPFDDTVREAGSVGIRYIIQPGGSIRDDEVIKACDELGVAMVFTGMRHFKH